MDIYINSDCYSLHDDAKVADAIAQLNLTGTKGIALAVNDDVVPRNEWDTRALQHGDKLMLIRATQGG
jgi:sulfur carrier protein